jgi:hypothetical protein
MARIFLVQPAAGGPPAACCGLIAWHREMRRLASLRRRFKRAFQFSRCRLQFAMVLFSSGA